MNMKNQYIIKFDDEIIGHTLLEKGDAPMGVALGAISFKGTESGYKFIMLNKNSNSVTIYENIPEDNFVNASFENIKVISESGTEIKGIGVNITGFDNDFEISIIGIPYPFYKEEFPNHVKAYENQFK